VIRSAVCLLLMPHPHRLSEVIAGVNNGIRLCDHRNRLRPSAFPRDRRGFNPTRVRLKLLWVYTLLRLPPRFNPTKLRLKRHDPSRWFTMSVLQPHEGSSETIRGSRSACTPVVEVPRLQMRAAVNRPVLRCCLSLGSPQDTPRRRTHPR